MLGSFSPKARRAASRYRCGSDNTTQNVPKSAVYHGEMCAVTEDATPVDVILGVSVESIQAVTIHQHRIVYQCLIAAMKEVMWDHSEKSVQFALDDNSLSPSFIFPVLTELEAHLSAIFASLEQPPEQVYIGVLIGQNLPSPIQQRRTPVGFSRPATLSMTERRELLQREQPIRHTVSRERLGIEYIRTGYLSFTCSINGDLRGLTLGVHQINVFPTPDCHDRSACLLSYEYGYLDSCEVAGTQLKLRFRMSQELAKQPGHLVFQSLEAQYIREAIWYFKHGTYMDTCLREMLASPTRTSPPSIQSPRQILDNAAPRRKSAPIYFTDTDSLKHRIDVCCRAIGCPHLGNSTDKSCCKPIEGSGPSMTVNSGEWNRETLANVTATGLCDQHVAYLLSPPNTSLSRRSALSRDRLSLPAKSLQPLIGLIQSSHYEKMFKFQGQLLKRRNVHKFHLRKTWRSKYVVLFETPVGGFLCYYDRLTHCPGMTEIPKERRMIDLSSVICIRPVSTASPVTRGNGSIKSSSIHAFDVVTLYRTWTFAAFEPKEYEVWLNVLTDAVEKHASMAPDKPLSFPVRQAMTGHSTPSEATSLEISPFGVSFCTGSDGDVVLSTWYYTDLEKWSVVLQRGHTCCLLRCKSPAPISSPPCSSGGVTVTQDYLFRTTEASAICLAIEFYVGKCMAKLEVLTGLHLEETQLKTKEEANASETSALQSDFDSPMIGLPTWKELHMENADENPEGTVAVSVETRDPAAVEVLVNTNEALGQQEHTLHSQQTASGTSSMIPLAKTKPMNENLNVVPMAGGTHRQDFEPAIALFEIPVQVDTNKSKNLPMKGVTASAGVELPASISLETKGNCISSSACTPISVVQPLKAESTGLAKVELWTAGSDTTKYDESALCKNQAFDSTDVLDPPCCDNTISALQVDDSRVKNLDAEQNHSQRCDQDRKTSFIINVVDTHEELHGISMTSATPIPTAASASNSVELQNPQNKVDHGRESECEISDRFEEFNSCASDDVYEDAIDSDALFSPTGNFSSALELELRLSSVDNRNSPG